VILVHTSIWIDHLRRRDEVLASLPADTTMTTPDERIRVIDARRRAVQKRFYR